MKCKQPIVKNDWVQYSGDWHVKCFGCHICGRSVIYDKLSLMQGTLLCQICKSSLETHCGVCRKIVGDLKKEAHGRMFHHSCFNCSICKRPLGLEESHFSNGQLFCSACYKDK
jgi:hypothetical protein